MVIEFGVRWGANLGLFQSLRGMYEPFNYNRKIVGFETHTYQLYNLDGVELPIQQIWDPVIDINDLFSDEADDNFNDYDDINESNILREFERLGEEVFNQQNEYISEESLEETLEETLEDSLENIEVEVEVEEEEEVEVEEEEEEEVQEGVESSYEIIENSVVIPTVPEVERFVEEFADRESIIITEINFTSSVIQVI